MLSYYLQKRDIESLKHAKSKENAIQNGDKYYKGKPCCHGHGELRLTCSDHCPVCLRASLKKSHSKMLKAKEDRFFGHASKMVDIDHMLDNLSIDENDLANYDIEDLA